MRESLKGSSGRNKQLRNSDLVLLSLETYSDVRRRHGHVIEHFLRDGTFRKIMWVNPPYRLGFRNLPRIKLFSKHLIVFTPVKIIPEKFINLLFYSLWVQLRIVFLFLGIRDQMYWINDINWFKLSKTNKPVVYDLTDDWLAEPNMKTRIVQGRRKRENYILQKCDVAISCSQELIVRKASVNSHLKFLLIPNGVDKRSFQINTDKEDNDWKYLDRHAVYVGSLHESRLDIDLVEALSQLVSAHGFEVSLIGPNFLRSENTERLLSAGVNFLGEVDYRLVPIIMNSAGVLILPHLVNSFTDSLDPIKLYEYLCSSTIAVSTEVAGFRDFKNEIHVLDSQQFVITVIGILNSGLKRKPTPNLTFDWVEVSDRFEIVFESLVK